MLKGSTDLVAFAEARHELMVQLVKMTQVTSAVERPTPCPQRTGLSLDHLGRTKFCYGWKIQQ